MVLERKETLDPDSIAASILSESDLKRSNECSKWAITNSIQIAIIIMLNVTSLLTLWGWVMSLKCNGRLRCCDFSGGPCFSALARHLVRPTPKKLCRCSTWQALRRELLMDCPSPYWHSNFDCAFSYSYRKAMLKHPKTGPNQSCSPESCVPDPNRARPNTSETINPPWLPSSKSPCHHSLIPLWKKYQR